MFPAKEINILKRFYFEFILQDILLQQIVSTKFAHSCFLKVIVPTVPDKQSDTAEESSHFSLNAQGDKCLLCVICSALYTNIQYY